MNQPATGSAIEKQPWWRGLRVLAIGWTIVPLVLMLILALGAGFGEEILFRGALQPAFGLIISSLLFAVTHIQYGLTPITLIVFVIGIILGLVRRYSNTSVAIFIHVGYNFVLGLLSLLAVYLEQFIE